MILVLLRILDLFCSDSCTTPDIRPKLVGGSHPARLEVPPGVNPGVLSGSRPARLEVPPGVNPGISPPGGLTLFLMFSLQGDRGKGVVSARREGGR